MLWCNFADSQYSVHIFKFQIYVQALMLNTIFESSRACKDIFKI